MPIYKHAHAFHHINKTVISKPPIEQSLQLDVLGSQMNSSALTSFSTSTVVGWIFITISQFFPSTTQQVLYQ
jgi:hypothetical protein